MWAQLSIFKRGCLVVLLLIAVSGLKAQIKSAIVEKVNGYPPTFKHYEQLVQQITNDFKNDKDRAAAIYVWVAANIAYDTNGTPQSSMRISYRSEEEKLQKLQQLRKELAVRTLKKKRAVCQGYAELYRLLCEACGIRCEVVEGYSKTRPEQIGQMPQSADHAWNAIWLDEKWHWVDVTWGAGHVKLQNNRFVPDFSDVYFMMSPALFALNHFPEDVKWLNQSGSIKEFAELALFHKYYFSSNLRVVPLRGTITKASKGHIKIEIKGAAEGKQLHYAFHDQKYMQQVKGERKGKRWILSIPVEHRKTGYLDLISNNKTIVTYKLMLK
ncbi:transglutaminase domain-containing protein [Carboxylicivirga taeanensis]|uniref:transglutaminase domain-containing protein n=1 Tax=Carboxylicivirga taeanensis TaxID=1416875 RepID=UPI003F6DF70A